MKLLRQIGLKMSAIIKIGTIYILYRSLPDSMPCNVAQKRKRELCVFIFKLNVLTQDMLFHRACSVVFHINIMKVAVRSVAFNIQVASLCQCPASTYATVAYPIAAHATRELTPWCYLKTDPLVCRMRTRTWGGASRLRLVPRHRVRRSRT